MTMVFWRKKKNITTQEEQEREDRIVHHPDDPAIEPPTEYDADMPPALAHELFHETESEILDELGETPVPDHDLPPLKKKDEGGWLKRLSAGLSSSSRKISQGLGDILIRRKLDQAMLDELEDLLIAADLGPKTASRIVGEFGKGRFDRDITEQEAKEALAGAISSILAPVARELDFARPAQRPFVVLVCGVNGVGKTTTIGKIANDLVRNRGMKVLIAAGDTFRAAAVEQLQIWADRSGSQMIRKDIGADAAAVAYEAVEKARAERADVLLIDTAGRLHNKANLMAELQKIVRVMKKQDESLPHAVLLVLDATTGQNAFEQVRMFREMVDVTGLVVTKLDGSAKGGVVVGLADQFGLPVHMVGVGEKMEDLRSFDAMSFARALAGL